MRRVLALLALTTLLAAACGSDGDGDLEAFCEGAERAAAQGEAAEPDAESLAEDRENVEMMMDNAPDEIEDAAQTAGAEFLAFVDAIEENLGDDAAIEEAVGPLFDDPDVDAAAAEVSAFALAECGVDLE